MDKKEISSKQSKWTCSYCTFLNPETSTKCQMCDQQRSKTLLKAPQKRKAQEEKQATIQCPNPKCKKSNRLTAQTCAFCQKPIFQFEEQEEIPIKKVQKKQIKLVTCRKCKFENDPTNAKCVNCQKKLVPLKIPMKSARSYKAHRYGGIVKNCPECGEVAHYDWTTGTVQFCLNCDINSGKRLQKDYCLFCFKNIDKAESTTHEDICIDRLKFFQKQGNPTFARCTPLQFETMIYMHTKCEFLHERKIEAFTARVKSLGYSIKDLENLQHYIINYAPIIIHMHVNTHFHYFIKDTHYRNQFETSMSSGSLSHSARTGWEDRMFDGKHHSATGYERVKYGTMNFVNDPTGVRACVWYGQSYFLLKPHVRDRCTITDMDSSSPSATLGTFRFIYHLLMKLSDAQIHSAFQGSKGKEMLSHVIGTYKEIQIHGPVEFAKDIERVYISKAQLKLGDPQLLLEQVKTFCSKHNIDYELFEGNQGMGMVGMPALPPGGGQAPGRVIEARKELSADDLKPPPPPPAPVGFGGGMFGHAGFGGLGGFGGFGVPAPAPAFVFHAPIYHPPAPVRPPPKRSQYGVDYI